MRGELKELEAWFVDHGHLAKDWREQIGNSGAGDSRLIGIGPIAVGVTAAFLGGKQGCRIGGYHRLSKGRGHGTMGL